LPSGLGSGQGWYNLSLAINPSNTNELISGGLDAYRSTNSGATWTRFTNWVSTTPYVHADHHVAQYWIAGGQTRMILGTDGGLFYSTNNGTSFVSKNRNLGIKQFYAAAIHPTAGSPYIIAGAQDNGTHQLKNPGLSYSIEVTGGDGMFVHINQLNPLIQFGSYVYNQYRRSTNGGNTWSSVNLSSSVGLFVNPFDYDDAQNIMYCSNGPVSQVRRWINANSSSTNSSIQFSTAKLGSSTVSLTSFKVSPYTTNRLFFGTNNGRLFRLENANTVTTATSDANTTSIGGSGFPVGTISCVATGTDDNNLVAVFSNYGVNNVWITNDGGTTWSAIDGDLPDMPVRWALFEPGSNDKIYLATEAGVYTSTNIDGANTNWLPESTFPAVRTDMIKLRASDSTIVAGTHGRGIWTAKIPSCVSAQINTQPSNAVVCEDNNASFTVAASGSALTYQWQVSTDGGTTYNDINNATDANLNLNSVTAGMNGYRYKCIIDTYCSGLLTTDEKTLTVNTEPGITCPSAVSVFNGAGLCGAFVNYSPANATGMPVPVITYSHPPGTFFPVGTTTVTATATNDCGSASCTFDVTVADNEPPVITAPAQFRCYEADNYGCSVNLGASATDNCELLSLTSNAPACFPVGSTIVTWTATDIYGNISTKTQTVTRNPEIHITLCAGPTRTIYSGTYNAGGKDGIIGPFGPQSVNLSSSVSGGQPGYSYSWSPAAGLNNPNIANPVASPAITTTYTLTVTDSKGCTRTMSITVKVLPLSAAICTTNGAVKFNVCHIPQGEPGSAGTICVSYNALGAHLKNGTGGHGNCYLGTCDELCFSTASVESRGTSTTNVTMVEDPLFTVKISPNPSSSSFEIQVQSVDKLIPASIRVLDATGKPVETFTNIAINSRLKFGTAYHAGNYFVEVVQGSNRKLIKLIKLN
jgi:photosystem II stability/assembly factor-like uncharacterized protein